MTAHDRLTRTQSVLTVAALGLGVLWAVAAAALFAAAFALLDLGIGLPASVRTAVPVGSMLFGVAVFAVVSWRNRRVRSREEVALWLEWRVPALRYSLVTMVDERFTASGPALETVVSGTSWAAPIRQALLRSMRLPGVLLFLAAVALRLLPAAGQGDTAAIDGAGPGSEPAGGAVDPFRSFVVTVRPPAYSRLSPSKHRQPEAVTSLVGSAISIEGDGWTAGTTMPDTAKPLWLERDGRRRLLLLLPIPDSVPVVHLLAPARDSVLRAPGGIFPLSGNARDDFGLSQAWFEYIVSSDKGENYTFRSGVVGRRAISGAARADLTSGLIVDSLKLAPGNIVHLRAVARDHNTVTGPGIGYSDTRTIRIPRPGEDDSISVDGVAPAQGDSSLLSQRMLVIMAEALERRRPRLGRDTFVGESRRIAGEQATLRRRVADIIFLRLGTESSMEESEDSTAEPLTPEALLEAAEQATTTSGGETLDFSADETPVVALNRPLLEAYNAMWAAGRELEIGEPRRALPHMREALEAIQRARQAERIYLRGRPSATVIDLAKVRLAGKLADAAPAGTLSPAPNRRIREALLGRFSRAIQLLPAPGVVDSLQLLRIDALESELRFAAALGDAVTALRAGRDATVSLIQARRLLAGLPESIAGLVPWDVAP